MIIVITSTALATVPSRNFWRETFPLWGTRVAKWVPSIVVALAFYWQTMLTVMDCIAVISIEVGYPNCAHHQCVLLISATMGMKEKRSIVLLNLAVDDGAAFCQSLNLPKSGTSSSKDKHWYRGYWKGLVLVQRYSLLWGSLLSVSMTRFKIFELVLLYESENKSFYAAMSKGSSRVDVNPVLLLSIGSDTFSRFSYFPFIFHLSLYVFLKQTILVIGLAFILDGLGSR